MIRQLLADSNLFEAERRLRRILANDPRDIELAVMLGQLLAQQSKFVEAESVLRVAVRSAVGTSFEVEAVAARVEVLLTLGEMAKPDALTADLLTRHPGDVAAIKSRASVLLVKAQAREATALLQTIGGENASADVIQLLVESMRVGGDVAGALGVLERALPRLGDQPFLMLKQAELLIGVDRSADSLEVLERVPPDPRIEVYRGDLIATALWFLGRTAEALVEARKAAATSNATSMTVSNYLFKLVFDPDPDPRIDTDNVPVRPPSPLPTDSDPNYRPTRPVRLGP
jgi:predicted Zn-dependent protease